MRYFIRSCKYVVYFALLFTVMVGVVWLLSPEKAQGLPVTALFKEGSLKNILILFIAVSAIYPSLSFVRRTIHLEDGFPRRRNTIVEVFDNAGMDIESETGSEIRFRMRSRGMRFSRMWEDRITVRIEGNTLLLDGYRRDLDRIVRAINYTLKAEDHSPR